MIHNQFSKICINRFSATCIQDIKRTIPNNRRATLNQTTCITRAYLLVRTQFYSFLFFSLTETVGIEISDHRGSGFYVSLIGSPGRAYCIILVTNFGCLFKPNLFRLKEGRKQLFSVREFWDSKKTDQYSLRQIFRKYRFS